MPELPEVHTTTFGLNKVMTGEEIVDVWSDWPRILRHGNLSEFKNEVVNQKVLSVKRRAKHILINLQNDRTIVIHMKMTGHLLYGKWKLVGKKWLVDESEKNDALRDPYNRFIHFMFNLKNGKQIAFSDTRKFGKVALEKTSNLEHSPLLSHLGPEPLNSNFNKKLFEERIFKRKKSKIKTTLMDQTIIAGIGNIYSDEILWRANVNPERRVESLSKAEISKIFENIKPLLKRGIALGGDSMSDYRNIHGERGKFQNNHMVYRKTGEQCQKRGCVGVIKRKVVNGRSAHFCSLHQK